MADSTNDVVPLTPLVVDVVTFDRAPLGRRGYHEDQVDEYLDRIQATLAGTDNLTAQEVREVVFDAAPLIRRGYHEDQVDDFLDLVITELDNRERSRSARAAQRQPIPHAATSPTSSAERTSRVLPTVPVDQPQTAAAHPSFPGAAAASTSFPRATAPGPSFPPAAAASPSLQSAGASGPPSQPATASPRSTATSFSFPPAAASPQAPASNPSFPAAPAPRPSFPAASTATPSAAGPPAPNPPAAGPSAPNPPAAGTSAPSPSAPNPSAAGPSAPSSSGASSAPNQSGWPDTTQQPPAMSGRGPLALPLPPTPPNERGYHPADVARLVALLKEPSEPPSSAAITGMRLNRMDVGQGYHAGAVDAMRAIWITELRRRGL